MATTPQTIRQDPAGGESSLQELAKQHLWMHFTRMSAYKDAEVPIIVRGEGCYVYDENGKRYLDGLSALFCVNAGHGRTEIGEAMAEQVKELGFYTNWSYAHPRAIELANRVAGYAPEGLDRVFFTSGGSEAVESALKLCRIYHRRNGEATRYKVIAREIAYHGTTMGALTATGIPDLRAPFEPLVPGGRHAPNTNSYRWPEERDPLWAADQIEERILFEGPETVAAVILEPVQNAGGCFTPQEGYWQRVREICDRHGVLLISDEVICSWGRLGHWFGCERSDQDTKETFDDDESEVLLRGYLSGALYEHGLICRADDRGDPVIQLSPPLISDSEQFEEIEATLRAVLTEASQRVVASG